MMHEKMQLLYHAIMEAAEKAGAFVIIDRMYVIDRETGAASTMQIMQHEGRESRGVRNDHRV